MATNANNPIPATANPPAGVPWDQTPEYIALTNRTIAPGGRTTYVVPHPMGASPTDLTSFIYGQATITLNTWPNLMYMLEPTPEWRAAKASAKPPQKVDSNGQPMFERWPKVGRAARPLLDYKGLPDQISTNEDWWWFDLWRRLHPQSKWADILMRIEVPIRDSLWDTDYRNAFQTDLKRKYHSRYFMIAAPWFGTGRGTADALVPIHAALQAANVPIQLNTTRGVTPGPVDPTQVNGRHIPHPALPPRIYQRRRHNGQPVLRNSRQAPASHTPDGDTNIDDYEYDDEDSGEDNYEEEVPGQNSVNVDNGVSGECGCSDDGEGLTAPSSNAINHPSAASEEVVAGRLRSSRRRLPSTPPANSFTPINPTSTQRKRHQKRVTPHQVQKKILSTSNLKAFLKSKGSTVDVDELLEWTEGCQNGGDDADREDPAPSLRGSRRQHRPHTPTTEIPDTVSHAGKQPTRRAIVPLGEQSTQTNGPSTAINGRRMSDPIAEHRYDLPLSAYIGDPTLHVTRHQSSYLNNQWIPRAPTAPMNIPSAFDRARPHIQEVPRAPLAPTNPHFAGVVARAPGPFMYSSQGLHFDEAPSYLMPPPSHQANGERSGYTSFQQALNNRNSPAPSANSSSINSTSDQNNAGYEPCGSWFECDDLFREYEGW